MGEGEPDSPIASMTGMLRVGVTQAADRVGAVVGHDDQDVAHVVGNVPSYQSLQCLFVVEIEGEALTSGRRPCPCLQAPAPLVSVRDFAVKMTREDAEGW